MHHRTVKALLVMTRRSIVFGSAVHLVVTQTKGVLDLVATAESVS